MGNNRKITVKMSAHIVLFVFNKLNYSEKKSFTFLKGLLTWSKGISVRLKNHNSRVLALFNSLQLFFFPSLMYVHCILQVTIGMPRIVGYQSTHGILSLLLRYADYLYWIYIIVLNKLSKTLKITLLLTFQSLSYWVLSFHIRKYKKKFEK